MTLGLTYLNGKRWADVTREERYFCMHLYNRIVAAGVPAFVRDLRDSYGCAVNADADWELTALPPSHRMRTGFLLQTSCTESGMLANGPCTGRAAAVPPQRAANAVACGGVAA
jgi:hypothetical protein